MKIISFFSGGSEGSFSQNSSSEEVSIISKSFKSKGLASYQPIIEVSHANASEEENIKKKYIKEEFYSHVGGINIVKNNNFSFNDKKNEIVEEFVSDEPINITLDEENIIQEIDDLLAKKKTKVVEPPPITTKTEETRNKYTELFELVSQTERKFKSLKDNYQKSVEESKKLKEEKMAKMIEKLTNLKTSL
mmetsp:Transcript_19307/g.17124  ORF Transcript_19307/g.17124 Transcript_19307/m.17124 type:complete len:191 (+) Transcript_19307:120-692(+)